jgi:hypothetical protein
MHYGRETLDIQVFCFISVFDFEIDNREREREVTKNCRVILERRQCNAFGC